jgi:hypothetical protein
MMAVSEVQIGVRFPRAAYKVLTDAAELNHCGPSTFARRLIMQTLGIEEKLILPSPEPDASFNGPAHEARGRRGRRSRA